MKRSASLDSLDPLTAAHRARPRLLHALGDWFERERRDLPWRRSRDPYAIWISEAMLQQTRVEVVIPYYLRFLARFPDVAALAAAEDEEVLALWSGLGYYSRARALRAAARQVLERHGGALPRTRDEWLALPGVGPYTAGAVLSIAFSAAEALVDGNVVRVLARLFALEPPRGSPALNEQCWALARLLVPSAAEQPSPGDWNQALMELGARVCTPRSPRCESCPLREHCRARAEARAEELPRAAPRVVPHEVTLEILVAREHGRFLCKRRPAGGRMAGLLEFPTRELVPSGGVARLWPARDELALRATGSLGSVRHAITCHRIRAAVLAAQHGGVRGERALPEHARWFAPEELVGAALTGLTRKVLALPSVRSAGLELGEAPPALGGTLEAAP